jgi:hypothetical protein
MRILLLLLLLAVPVSAQDMGIVIRTTTSYTVRPIDAYVFADATSGAITITLPDPAYYLMKEHKVCKTDSSTNVVTVTYGTVIRRLYLPDSCGTFSPNRASSTMTSTSAGGEKWVVTAISTSHAAGSCTLVAGTCTVSTTAVAAGSRIFLTGQDANANGTLHVSARVAATSFTITSSDATDTGVVAWQISEP